MKFIIEEDVLRMVIELIGTIAAKAAAPVYMKLHNLEVHDVIVPQNVPQNIPIINSEPNKV